MTPDYCKYCKKQLSYPDEKRILRHVKCNHSGSQENGGHLIPISSCDWYCDRCFITIDGRATCPECGRYTTIFG